MLWGIPWWGWTLIANASITAVEFLNRTRGWSSPLEALPKTLPLIVIAQVGIFAGWRYAPSLMVAWATFFVGNTLMRLASAHFLVGEEVSSGQLASVLLICCGAAGVHYFKG